MTTKNIRLNRSGFTMVELLVAMVVASIVLTLIYQTYMLQLKSHTTQQEVVEMQQNMRAALYLMEREIRMAGFNPLRSAGVGVTNASANSITFSMDVSGGETDSVDNDNDSLTDEWPEPDGVADPSIQYVLQSDGQLQRIAGTSPASTIARGIDSVAFEYLDGNSVITAVPSDIRSVRIQLTASLPTTPMINGAGKGMAATSEVKCRNLGTN